MKNENEEMKNLVSAYLLGDLEAEQSEKVKQFLAENPAEAQEAEELQQTLDLLQEALADTGAVPEGLTSAQRERVGAVVSKDQAEAKPAPVAPPAEPSSSVVKWFVQEHPILTRVAALAVFFVGLALLLPRFLGGIGSSDYMTASEKSSPASQSADRVGDPASGTAVTGGFDTTVGGVVTRTEAPADSPPHWWTRSAEGEDLYDDQVPDVATAAKNDPAPASGPEVVRELSVVAGDSLDLGVTKYKARSGRQALDPKDMEVRGLQDRVALPPPPKPSKPIVVKKSAKVLEGLVKEGALLSVAGKPTGEVTRAPLKPESRAKTPAYRQNGKPGDKFSPDTPAEVIPPVTRPVPDSTDSPRVPKPSSAPEPDEPQPELEAPRYLSKADDWFLKSAKDRQKQLQQGIKGGEKRDITPSVPGTPIPQTNRLKPPSRELKDAKGNIRGDDDERFRKALEGDVHDTTEISGRKLDKQVDSDFEESTLDDSRSMRNRSQGGQVGKKEKHKWSIHNGSDVRYPGEWGEGGGGGGGGGGFSNFESKSGERDASNGWKQKPDDTGVSFGRVSGGGIANAERAKNENGDGEGVGKGTGTSYDFESKSGERDARDGRRGNLGRTEGNISGVSGGDKPDEERAKNEKGDGYGDGKRWKEQPAQEAERLHRLSEANELKPAADPTGFSLGGSAKVDEEKKKHLFWSQLGNEEGGEGRRREDADKVSGKLQSDLSRKGAKAYEKEVSEKLMEEESASLTERTDRLTAQRKYGAHEVKEAGQGSNSEKEDVLGEAVDKLEELDELGEEDKKKGQDLEDDLDDGKSVYRAYAFNPWVAAATNAFSTFAIDVDSASYTQARNFIRSQQLPPADAVRTEEFLNFFNYQYAPPVGNTFAVHLEAAPTPFGDGHLLKVGVKGKRLGRDQQRAARLTFCVDASGSMDTDDRIGLIRSSLTRLADQLGDDDEVAIVYYGSKAHLLLEHTSDKEKIREAIKAIPIGGSTHLEEGLKLAYETASGEFDSRNENRVLLLSDGAANLGAASAGEILEQVGGFRQQGISCSVFGFGIGTYNDTMLETLANKGDGSYQFIDSEEESQRVFVTELAATLSTIASDVKIQVEFNPDRVREFRQVGYENRQLKKEDFRNDTVDAGEVGSGQSVTALYEVGLQGEGNQEVGVVRIRFRNLDGEVEEMVHPIRASDVRSTFDGASAQFRLAASVAEFSEILRGSPFADGSQYSEVVPVLRPVVQELHLDSHVQELLQLVQAAAHGLPRAE